MPLKNTITGLAGALGSEVAGQFSVPPILSTGASTASEVASTAMGYGAGFGVNVPSASDNSGLASSISNFVNSAFGTAKANAPVNIKAPNMTTEETNRVLKLSPAAQKLGIKSGVTPADSWKELIKGSYDLIYPHVVGDFRHMKDDFKVWKVASTAIKKKAPSIMKLFSIFTALEGWALAQTDPVLGKVRSVMGGANFTSFNAGKFVTDKVNDSLGSAADMAYKITGMLGDTSNALNTASDSSFQDLYNMANQLTGTATSPSGVVSRAANTLMSTTKTAIADTDKEFSTATNLLTEVNPGNSLKVATINKDPMTLASQAKTIMKAKDTTESLAEEVALEAQCMALEKIFGNHGPLPDMSEVAVPPNGRVHTQDDPSNKWVIPAVGVNTAAQDVTITVFDQEGFEVAKDEFYINPNGDAVVTFLKDVAGRAVLVGVMQTEDPSELPSKRAVQQIEINANTQSSGFSGARGGPGGGYTPNKNKAANKEATEEDNQKLSGKLNRAFLNLRDETTMALFKQSATPAKLREQSSQQEEPNDSGQTSKVRR